MEDTEEQETTEIVSIYKRLLVVYLAPQVLVISCLREQVGLDS